MTESKREKFERIRDVRLPKAAKAIELLQNIGRKSDYDYDEKLAREITDQLYDAVDGVADALGLPPADAPGLPPADYAAVVGTCPNDIFNDLTFKDADGDRYRYDPEYQITGLPVRAPHRSRVRWAHDMLKRGDRKDAEEVLKQIIAEWIEDERAT